MSRIFKLTGFQILLAAFILLFTGCQSAVQGPPPIQLITPDINQTLPAHPPVASPLPGQPTSTSSQEISSPVVMDACNLDLQNQAMLPSSTPPWESLGIDTCYDLTLDLTSGGPDYTGSVHITYTNSSPVALADIVLRLYPNAGKIYGGRLEITSARVGDSEINPEDLLADRTAQRLPLPDLLAPGTSISLNVDFQGSLPVDFSSGETYGIFNMFTNGPVLMMANAYPILAARSENRWRVDPVYGEGDAVVSETALYQVRIDIPESWQVAATGRQVEQKAGNGIQSLRFASGPVREFMLAASRVFQAHEVVAGDVHIIHWALPETISGQADSLDAARESLQLYNQNFGPYPYIELDVVDSPLMNASGVEYPGLILIGETLYSTSDPGRLATVVAHEVAHQWWYGLVGSDVLLHPWQDEALATFSSQLYNEKFDPPYYRGANNYYEESVQKLEETTGSQRVDNAVASFANRPSAYGIVVYLKGALFFEAVRTEIGDQKFFDALQAYFRQYEYREAQPQDLLNSFEASCGCNLSGLFAEWGVDQGSSTP